MKRYRIKPSAILVAPPDWVAPGQIYEGEVDLLASSFAGKKVRLSAPNGNGFFSILLREVESME